MADFTALSPLRRQKADLERTVQGARSALDGLRLQMRGAPADPAARAAIQRKIAKAEATLATTMRKLTTLVASLNRSKTELMAAGARRPFVPTNPAPALLFPLRIETCFHMLSPGTFMIQVRFYPDPVAIETHEPELTAEEARLAEKFALLANAPDLSKRQDAWRGLAKRVGVRRAAWIQRLRDQGGPLTQGRMSTWSRAPVTRVMPDRIDAYLFDGTEQLRVASGRPIPEELAVLWNPNVRADPNETELFDAGSRWISNFDLAKEVGMALEFTPVPEPRSPDGFSIFAVGLKESASSAESAELVKKLFESHQHTSGFSFVPPDTPTNNTRTVAAGYTKAEDPDDVHALETGPGENITDGRTDGARMAKALGIGAEAFAHTKQAGVVENAFVEAMHTALWPALGGYFFRYLIEGAISEVSRIMLGEHFRSWVRARGPLPSIRVGNLPYGVLPVTSLSNWRYSAHEASAPTNRTEATFFPRCHETLLRLLSKVEGRPVPRIGASNDPDRELLQVLAMQPGSQSVKVRPVVDDKFVSLLVSSGANAAPVSPAADRTAAVSVLIAQWVNEWESAQTVARTLLTSLGVANADGPEPSWIGDSKVLDLFPWGDGMKWGKPMAQSGDLRLSEFLTWSRGSNDLNSLLCELLRSAKELEGQVQNTSTKVAEATDVLAALEEEPARLERLMLDSFDLHAFRLDAWITSFATKRLFRLREKAAQAGQAPTLMLGAYGWVVGLHRNTTAHGSDGYILAPTPGHAVTAAVLRNAYLTHDGHAEAPVDNPFCINITSARAGRAARLIDGVRQGQPIGALLGYQLERDLHEQRVDRFIEFLRDRYPFLAHQEVAGNEPAESVAARNVVDGLKLVREWRNPVHKDRFFKALADHEVARGVPAGTPPNPKLIAAIEAIVDAQDAVADVLIHEVVHHAAQGALERSGAALDALNAGGRPPELEALHTRQPGRRYAQRVCVLLPTAGSDRGPQWNAEPRVASWVDSLLGPQGEIAFDVVSSTGERLSFTLDALGLDAVDLLDSSEATGAGDSILEQRIRCHVRTVHGLKHDATMTLVFNPPAAAPSATFEAALADALEVLRRIKDALRGASALEPDALCSPEDAQSADYDAQTVTDLYVRLEAASKVLYHQENPAMPDAEPPLPTGVIVQLADTANEQTQADGLIMASRFGVQDAVPAARTGDPMLADRVVRARQELRRRFDAARAALDASAAIAEAPKRVTKLLGGFASLFGKQVTVLPTFATPGPAGAVSTAFKTVAQSVGATYTAVLARWISQVAHVREPVRRFEDALLAAAAWCTTRVDSNPRSRLRSNIDRWAPERHEWRAIQLPYVTDARWVGLPDPGAPPATRPRGVASTVVYARPTISFTEPLAGVMLDQWEEFIPSKDVTAGMALQFDQPGAEAPQALLMAVPPVWDDGATAWTPDELVGILRDTLRLSQARLVDLDAQDGLGALIPGMFVPVDPGSAIVQRLPPFPLRAARDLVGPLVNPLDPRINPAGSPAIDPASRSDPRIR